MGSGFIHQHITGRPHLVRIAKIFETTGKVDVDTLGAGWQQMDTEKEDLYTYEGRRIMVLYVLSEKTVSGIAHEVTVGSTFRCGKPGWFPQENDLEMGFENIYVGLPEAVL